MACIYKIKGHTFNSELELDDFILEKYKYLSKYGDIVFNSTPRQLAVFDQLNEIHKKALEDNHLYDLWREENFEYGEDGEITLDKYPYIGVNKFLSNQRIDDDHRLYPEFIPERYWKEQVFPRWKQGQFTDEEKEILGVIDGTKLTDDVCNTNRKKIERKWKIQAMSGTAVHGVLQLFFSKDGDTNVFDLENPKEWIINNLEPKWKPYLLNSDGTPKKVIDDAIQYAQNLKKHLTDKYGEDLLFFPEFLISGKANDIQSNNEQTLIGIVDLLVLDSEGRVHIIDYKTSIKDYNKFDITKKTAYKYQMATYRRILESQGINMSRSRIYVAPIKLNNFRWDNDQWVFDGLDISQSIVELNNEISEKFWDNIDRFLPPKINITLTGDQLEQKHTEFMSECFQGHSSLLQHTPETTKKYLEKLEVLKKNDKGEFVFKPYGTKDVPIVSKDEAEFINLVTEYFKNRAPKRIRVTGDVKESLSQAIKAKSVEGVNWTKLHRNKEGISLTWLQDTLKHYCNGRWKIIDNEELEAYGMIILYNEDTNQYDIIRISTNNLTENYRQFLKKDNPIRTRLGLTGQFEADVVEKSKSKSLMLQAINGNVEAMETMHILNLIDGLGNKNSIIGKIAVINPFDGDEICPSNEELLYSYNALTKHYTNTSNKFMSEGDDRIQLASKFRIAANTVLDVMEVADENQYKDKYKVLEGFKSCKSLLLDVANGDVDEKIEKLNEILRQLYSNDNTKEIVSKFYTNKSQNNSELILIHNTVITALAKLKGIDFRQQLKDHNKWLESAMIHKGLSGTYIDNPGNLDSETLNLITKLVTEAYQNTRDEVQRKKIEISKRVEAFKKAKGFDKLKENIGFNQVDLYKTLFVEVETGKGKDLLFKDLKSVTDPAEYEFLKFTLEEINKNRFNYSQEQFDRMRDTYDTEYYRVPLARGGSDSVVSTKGLMSMLKDTLKGWVPNNLWNRVKEKTEGVMSSLEDSSSQKEGDVGLFKMTNMFDKDNDTDSRLRIISKNGIETFERNIETLLLKHDFAYIQQKNVDTVFPLIKAATIHIANQGSMQNMEFKNDLQYIRDYIRNKIQNQFIVSKEYENFAKIAGLIKQAASKMTLAFAPVQMFYQPLQGLWTDIRLMYQNKGTQEPFTFNNFRQSIKLVYSDLFNFSGNPTTCSLLNELYGINDMDMNTYTERISKAKKGLFYNFDNMMFKFASRPDYYNRMSIFVSQMLGDGCLEAHTIKDGKLIYNQKLDKRFEAFANGRKSDPEYNKQKALYYAVAQQFVAEHAKNPDGSDFKLNMSSPMPLPRAYTAKQAESMKSLGDDIYGYYSHEKKSLIMSTALGSMWLQFKTYWSGKKNQYLQSGGVRLKGKWEQYSEKDKDGNEVKYYYQVDSKGNIEYDKPPTTKETIAPMMQWKGQWQEGILVTLGDCIAQSIQDPRHTIQHFKNKWNESDENLRNCYRSNIRQFEYDMFMLLIGGVILGGLMDDWLKEIKEESRQNTDFMEGCLLAAANVSVMSVKNSFLDFNFMETIGSPVGQWTPFAFAWTGRQWANICKVASGDEDLWDGALNTVGAGKQIRPIFDAIKPEMFRNKREGGTWESSTTIKNREKES